MYPDKRLAGLVGMSADKDTSSVGSIIASTIHSLHVVPVQHMRLMKCQDLYESLSKAAQGTQCTVKVRPTTPPPFDEGHDPLTLAALDLTPLRAFSFLFFFRALGQGCA